jgi:hypothetical protein
VTVASHNRMHHIIMGLRKDRDAASIGLPGTARVSLQVRTEAERIFSPGILSDSHVDTSRRSDVGCSPSLVELLCTCHGLAVRCLQCTLPLAALNSLPAHPR